MNRLAHAYEILALKAPKVGTLCSWSELKNYVFFRGVAIGAYLDASYQMVGGHWHNINRWARFRKVVDVQQGLVDIILNLALVEDVSTTMGFSVSAFPPSGEEVIISSDIGVVGKVGLSKTGYMAFDALETLEHGDDVDEDNPWLIMLRAKWLVAYGTQFGCLFNTDYTRIDLSGIVSRGADSVDVIKSSPKQVTNLINAAVGANGVDLFYTITPMATRAVSPPIRLSNGDIISNHFVFFSEALNKSLGRELWGPFRTLVASDDLIAIANGASVDLVECLDLSDF
jgi:hypothetical protein